LEKLSSKTVTESEYESYHSEEPTKPKKQPAPMLSAKKFKEEDGERGR